MLTQFCIKNCFVYTYDDKPEMTMPKQIYVKMTKSQNKHGHGRIRKCSIGEAYSSGSVHVETQTLKGEFAADAAL